MNDMEIYYGVYISQRIRFVRVSSHVPDFYTRNKSLTAKLLKQGYRIKIYKVRKAIDDLVSKLNSS